MHSIVSRVLIGLGVAVAALAAIGYAFVFSGIARPIAGDLGTVAVPAEGRAVPVYLSDGRPAFVVPTEDGVTVIDARIPLDGGAPGRLAAWCNGGFVDLVGVSSYTADGGLIAGDVPGGLIRYPTTLSSDRRSAAIGSDGVAAEPAADDESVPVCAPSETVVHGPTADETFDPSVAADQEPPGWIWMEGRLIARGGRALLCDRGPGCETGAVARGIDPAKVGANGIEFDGAFLGRIRDGAIDELYYAPQPEDVP